MEDNGIKQLVSVLQQFVERLSVPSEGHVSTQQLQGNRDKVADTLVSHSLKFEPFDEEKEPFKVYRQRLENFFAMKQLSGNSEEEKAAKLKVFINCLGAKHYQLLVSLSAPMLPTSKSYDELIDLLEKHLSPTPNKIIEQHKFLSRIQLPNESIASYVASLRQLTTTCDFNCPSEHCKVSVASIFLQAQFIRGLSDSTIRERLLQEKDLTWEKALNISLALEASKIGNQTLSGNSTVVNRITSAIRTIDSKSKKFQSENQNDNYRSRLSMGSSDSRSKSRPRSASRSRVNLQELGIEGLCLRCGMNNHKTRECRRNRNFLKCSVCKKIGHVAKVCIISLTKTKGHKKNTNMHNNEENIKNVSFNINKIKITDINRMNITSDTDKIMVPIRVDKTTFDFEVDTGSPVTLMNENDFNKLNISEPLEQANNVLFRAYTQEPFAPIGVVKVPIAYGSNKAFGNLYVVPAPYAAIVGRSWLRPLKIIKINSEFPQEQVHSVNVDNHEHIRNEIFSKYADIFEARVGCVPDVTCTLRLKDKDVKPIFIKHRPIPYALQEKVEEELDSMERNQIIERIDYSAWGSPLVCVPKPNGNVRLCVDFRALNVHLQDARYPIPVIEDILNKLRGSKVFCVLDVYKAYQHLSVDEHSQQLQTISTHRGTYKMKRLAFGIKTAPSEFHKFIDSVLQPLTGVVAYFDDIVVHADSLQECHTRLICCLNRLRQFNLHLNKEKCLLFVSRIKYLGHVVSAEGIETSPDKVEAMLKAPRPQNVQQLRTFIGCVSYYSKFISGLADIMYPLYQLLKANSRFRWTTECESAFNEIKQQLASDRVLVKYDPKLPLILATDASPTGLSAVLSHEIDGEERPISFISRALTSTEQNYSQLDREATAIFWAFQKYYSRIYGRKFTLITDNKPLSYIFDKKRQLPSITASRLIRYAMFLSGFDYIIKHRKAEHHANADFLSRAHLPNKPTNEQDEDHQIYNVVVAHISNDTVTFNSIQAETEVDPELRELKKSLLAGDNVSTEFSLHDNVIFRGLRVVIPMSLQPLVLNELHSTHQGIVKMKALARRYCYWKNINRDIEATVKSCKAYADVKKNPKKVPLHNWEPPTENWQRVHMDYAGPHQGHYFYLMVDARSKWPEIIASKVAPTSASTIRMMKEIFSRNGIPPILVSDNATIFKSDEFKEFCRRNGIRQSFIAPGHPATNGQVERYVQTLKNKLKAMSEDPGSLHDKLHEILFRYRATPLEETSRTPAELFLNRNLRTRLDLMLSQPSYPKSIPQLGTLQLRLGERVQSRNYASSKLWKYGTVVEKFGNCHYLIELDDGYVLKRHIEQLRKTETPPQNQKRVTFKMPEDLTQIQPSEQSDTHEQNQPEIQRLPSTPIKEGSEKKHQESATKIGSNKKEQSSREMPKQSPTETQSNSEPILRRSSRVRRPVQRMDL